MKISVIVCAFNAKAYVEAAVRSVQNQTHPDVEIVVVDDCSTDGTQALIAQLAEADSRIRPVYMPRNGGPSAARNRALDASTGEWIAILDADDLFEPDRLARLAAYAAELDADVIVDNQIVQDFDSGAFVQHAFPFLERTTPMQVTQAFYFRSCADVAFINAGHFKPLVRRAFLEREQLRYHEDYRVCEDFILYAQMVAATGRFYAVPYCGYVYRVRSLSLSRTNAGSLTQTAQISDHLIRTLDGRLSGEAVKWLEVRARRTLSYIPWLEFKQSLRAHDPLGAARIVASHPGIVGKLADPLRSAMLRLQARRTTRTARSTSHTS